MNKKHIEKIYMGLIGVLIIVSGFFWVTWVAQAQLLPPIPGIPTIGTPQLPFLNSPYVLNTAGIMKNQNNTWDIPYSIPVNTQAAQFLLNVNGVTIDNGQILQGTLVFKAPDSAFGNAGSAIIGLKNKANGQIVAMNAVLVLNQLIQQPQYLLNQASVTQNADGSWNVGYYVPVNSIANQLVLTIGSNAPLNNGLSAYGGVVFRVPESYFTPGATLQLILTNGVTGNTLTTDVVFVPQSGLSQFVLDQSSIKQNANGTWDVAYQVPQNTIGTHFSVTPGSSALVANGAVTSGKLVFKIPEGSLTSGAQVVLVLKDETTGQVRATDTITVPTGLGVQYTLDPNEITTNPDNSWRVVWHVPVNTIGSDFVMVNGTKGEFDGGVMVNDTLVFKVPENMLALADVGGLVLKNIKDGKLYSIAGVMTQGVIPNAPMDTSKYVGGLLITFPPAGQTIKQTSATIKANLHALVDLPMVDTTYIWSKTGDPAANVEKKLLKVLGPIGMKMGEDQLATLSFTGLTAGKTYTFIVKNKITNTESDPIKFTTPTTANGKSYLSYTDGFVDYTSSGGYGAPSTGTALVDDISDKGIVPPCGRTIPDDASDELKKQGIPCGYQDFLQLISNILKYALIIFGPIVAVLVLYSGFVIMWLGRIPDPTAEQMQMLRDAKARLVKIGIGIAIILSAWVLIATITRELGVKSSYSLLDLFN
jgi:hypothetical protein